MEIVANATTVFPLNAISNDNISITLAQPLLAGNGRSIEIDLTTSVRSKLDHIKGIQLDHDHLQKKISCSDIRKYC